MMTGFTYTTTVSSKQIRDHHLCLKRWSTIQEIERRKEPIGFLLKLRTGVLGQDAKRDYLIP